MENNYDKELKIGDKVKVINYGHLIWYNTENIMWKQMENKPKIYSQIGNIAYQDINPYIVGKEGVISEISSHIPRMYSVDGIEEKAAWYNEDQLEKL